MMQATARPATGIQSFLHAAFVRYGTGSDLFLPLTRAKWWNVAAWTLIGVGTLGWAVILALWIL
jgi:hypothetical protein